ncbi:MAG TPA: hypothetical protein PLL76_20995 [Thermoanaerobaculia bacterium]|nr:hypothetical protein [Thermoanaerobaculia bacterium]
MKSVDDAIRQWRQGDVALEAYLFVDMRAGEAGPSDPDVVTSEVPGLVLLTQTCDVVRVHTERPWVEVAPLVEVRDPALMASIVRLERPRFALIPALQGERLVADLDRTMTIDKVLLTSWERTPGWTSDEEDRRFREALARKRSRPAFDDDFVEAVRRLSTRLRKNHGKESPIGHATTALTEIRVQASPSWTDPEVDVFFWFIHDSPSPDAQVEWDRHVETWLGLLTPTGRFRLFGGTASTLGDMTARDYVDSDRLDLDHLSHDQVAEQE